VPKSFFEVENFGQVAIFRRRGLRNIRLSVSHAGEVRLSLPWYVPKSTGIKYLRSKEDWIKKQLSRANDLSMKNGQLIFSNVSLKIVYSANERLITNQNNRQFTVIIPKSYSKVKAEAAAQRALNKFMVKQAKNQLMSRVENLAKQHGYSYESLKFRNLKSRWGSCDHRKNITLNTGLLRLEEEFINYVIIHELVHTRHLNHSAKFWQEVRNFTGDYQKIKRQLKNFSPHLKIRL